MKLINSAVATLKDMVVPASINLCPNCLDACKCTDPDACKIQM